MTMDLRILLREKIIGNYDLERNTISQGMGLL
jgi:hypothetical protein